MTQYVVPFLQNFGKMVRTCSQQVRQLVQTRPIGSVLGEEKKLSMATLSITLPDRLIEQVTPLSAISCWNYSLVYWLP